MGNRTNGVQFFKALMLHGRLTKEDAVKIPLIKQDPNAWEKITADTDFCNI